MTREETIRKTRILFWVQTACMACMATLFESGMLAKGSITPAPTARYIIDVAGVMLTITLIPLALKGFSTLIKREIERKNPHFIEFFHAKSTARLSILFAAIMMNIVLYYGTGNESALYCGILAVGAFIYSYPTMATLNNCLKHIKEDKEQ